MGDKITNFRGRRQERSQFGFFQMIFVGKGGIKILENWNNTS
jgi:hypothetical protein